MTIKELKVKVKKKFGTMARFCELAGLDRYQLVQIEMVKKDFPQSKITYLCHLCEAIKYPTQEFLDQVDSIREALDKFGGVAYFCRKHPEFLENTVYQILSKEYYKEATPKVKALMKKLKLK